MIIGKNTLEIFTNPIDWNIILYEIESYDFYHTYDYHLIEKPKGDVPTVLVYKENSVIIALPLLIRKTDNTEYYDATSVYGYAGPICNEIFSEFNNELFIKNIFREYE